LGGELDSDTPVQEVEFPTGVPLGFSVSPLPPYSQKHCSNIVYEQLQIENRID